MCDFDAQVDRRHFFPFGDSNWIFFLSPWITYLDLLPFLVFSTPTSTGIEAYQASQPRRSISRAVLFPVSPQPPHELDLEAEVLRDQLVLLSTTYLSCLTATSNLLSLVSLSFRYLGALTCLMHRIPPSTSAVRSTTRPHCSSASWPARWHYRVPPCTSRSNCPT